MKTTTLSALLVLGLLATSATALACPLDPVVDCATDLTDGDGQNDRVRNVELPVDVLDQDGAPACN